MLFDLNKERELTIEFVGMSGDVFTHVGTISAKMLDIMQKIEDMNLDSITMSNVTGKNQSATFNTKKILIDQKNARIDLLKSFFNEKYKEYINETKDAREFADDMVCGLLLDEVKRTFDLMEDEEDDDEKKA